MWGGTGDDRYMVDNYNDRITEVAGEGSDSVFASTSYKLADNIEKLTLTGSSDIWGYGNASDNVLTGNDGANKLYGLGGNDVIDGGAGIDQAYGGTGADTFVFADGDLGGASQASCDIIRDFSHAEADRIDLSGLDANSALSGNQAFAFLGTSAFTGSAGQLRYEESGGNTYLMGDTDGDGTADFMIRLDGSHALTSGDFIFG
jgi:Ca2+-binding RTX toxin-like protein